MIVEEPEQLSNTPPLVLIQVQLPLPVILSPPGDIRREPKPNETPSSSDSRPKLEIVHPFFIPDPLPVPPEILILLSDCLTETDLPPIVVPVLMLHQQAEVVKCVE